MSRPTFGDILNAVTDRLGVNAVDVLGWERRRPLPAARALISILAHDQAAMTYQEIARAFGRHDHSTFLNAAQRAQGMRTDLAALRDKLDRETPADA